MLGTYIIYNFYIESVDHQGLLSREYSSCLPASSTSHTHTLTLLYAHTHTHTHPHANCTHIAHTNRDVLLPHGHCLCLCILMPAAWLTLVSLEMCSWPTRQDCRGCFWESRCHSFRRLHSTDSVSCWHFWHSLFRTIKKIKLSIIETFQCNGASTYTFEVAECIR